MNATTSCVNITILDDSTLEDTHSFSLHLAAVDTGGVMFSPLMYTAVNIIDNDGNLATGLTLYCVLFFIEAHSCFLQLSVFIWREVLTLSVNLKRSQFALS